MPELTKKRRIESKSVELRFVGPVRKQQTAIDMLKSLGFSKVSDSMQWREVFPEYSTSDLPGVCLAGARAKEGITQQELSRMTGIPQRHISEMENGKRPIGRETAKKLGKALNVGYRVFL
jgi:ribosome-binding protein aMBF1 (putative translation factor)